MEQEPEMMGQDRPGMERIPVGTVESQETGDFSHSLEQLPDRVKEILGEEERQMLRQLFDKDRVTFEHSLEVSKIVDRVWPAFAADVEREKLTYTDMARAASLHDVGKLAWPDCILKGSIDTRQFTEMFMNFIKENPDQATEILRHKGILPGQQTVRDVPMEALTHLDHRDFVPLKYCFRDQPAATAEIIHSGLDPEMTFMDAIRIHEAKSREYISHSHLPDRDAVASLAGAHHNYSLQPQTEYRTSKEILRISDVFHAMVEKRSYQAHLGESEALGQIGQLAKKGTLDESVARRWLLAYGKHVNTTGQAA